MSVDVIPAKLRPYEIAKVVDKNSGLYDLYFARSSVVSADRILVTLYSAPVLS